MLKSIKDILKTMGEALTFANLAEMLTDEQKTELLSHNKASYTSASDTVPPKIVLVSDKEFSSEAVEHAIALCHKNNAMLDLLCVSSEGGSEIKYLATVLPLLETETKLDFQVTRRHGDLLIVIENLRARSDTLMILITVSESLRNRAKKYLATEKGFWTTSYPAVKLLDDLMPA